MDFPIVGIKIPDNRSTDIFGVHFAKVGDTFWIQLRERPRYWYSLTYAPGRWPWRLKWYWGWTFHYGEQKWKTGRWCHMGPFEFAKEEK